MGNSNLPIHTSMHEWVDLKGPPFNFCLRNRFEIFLNLRLTPVNTFLLISHFYYLCVSSVYVHSKIFTCYFLQQFSSDFNEIWFFGEQNNPEKFWIPGKIIFVLRAGAPVWSIGQPKFIKFASSDPMP